MGGKIVCAIPPDKQSNHPTHVRKPIEGVVIEINQCDKKAQNAAEF